MQPRRQEGQENDALLCVVGRFKGVACFEPTTLTLKRVIPTPKKENRRAVSIPPEDGRQEELIAVGEDEERDYEVVILHYSPHQKIDSPFRKLSSSHSSIVDGLSYVSPRFVVSGSGGPPAELIVSDVNSGEKVMDLKDAPPFTSRIVTTSSSTRPEARGSPQCGDGFVFVGGGFLGVDSSLRHYDLGRSERANEVVKMFKGHERFAYGMGYSPERNLLFSSSEDQTLRVWSVQDGTCLQKLQLPNESDALLYDAKKRLIFCGVRGGIIDVWDCRQTRERVRMFNHPTEDRELDFADLTQIDDESYASLGEEDCSVATWTDRGKVLAAVKTSGENYGMCFVGETRSPVVAAQQEERIAFLLSFSSVFWGVQVCGRHCSLTVTPAMMHPD